MRIFIVSLCLFLMGFKSSAQEYVPTIKDKHYWTILDILYTGGGQTWRTVKFRVDGEVQLDGKAYHRVERSTYPDYSTWTTDSYFREEQEKIWMKTRSDNPDILMYDFKLETGDSIETGSFGPCKLFVSDVSSIDINGKQRKLITLTSHFYTGYEEVWIEGIGSLNGLRYTGLAGIVGGSYHLQCFSVNEEVVYMNPLFNNCGPFNDIEEKRMDPDILYPNPTRGILKLENPEMLNSGIISVYNSTGKLMSEFENPINELDITNLQKGIYFIVFKKDNKVFYQKIIKQ